MPSALDARIAESPSGVRRLVSGFRSDARNVRDEKLGNANLDQTVHLVRWLWWRPSEYGLGTCRSSCPTPATFRTKARMVEDDYLVAVDVGRAPECPGFNAPTVEASWMPGRRRARRSDPRRSDPGRSDSGHQPDAKLAFSLADNLVPPGDGVRRPGHSLTIHTRETTRETDRCGADRCGPVLVSKPCRRSNFKAQLRLVFATAQHVWLSEAAVAPLG